MNPRALKRALKRSFAITAVVLLIGAATIAGIVAFGTRSVSNPAESQSLGAVLRQVDYSGLPELAQFKARDGTSIAYRAYPVAGSEKIALLIHGSAAHSHSMHGLARALQTAGAASVYALDMRGHGGSGKHGDIAYIGQLEDDVADVIRHLRAKHANAKLVLVGFSSGGGFAIRFAGSRFGRLADGYVFLAPFIHHDSPTNRPGLKAWTTPHVPRIIGLTILNRFGITQFNHLTAISFGIAPSNPAKLTPHYSYRLATNFRPNEDYKADLRGLKRPARLLIGTSDRYFDIAHYPAQVISHAPTIDLRAVKGVGHMGLVAAPAGIQAAVEAVQSLP